MYAKKTILIVSLESQWIKTEEIYFRNKKNRGSLSFWKDKNFLSHLNINDVFFESFGFDAKKSKYTERLNRLKKVSPAISEVYILMDNDRGSFSKEQVDNKVKEFNETLSSVLNIESSIFLEYERDMMNFEDFLGLHSPNQKLFKDYEKNHKSIYEKTMGKNGKNVKELFKNINKKNICWNFKKIFEIRKEKLKNN